MSKGSLCFLLEVLWFQILHLSLTRFEFTFGHSVKKYSFDSFACSHPVFPASLIEEAVIMSPLYSYLLCCKLIDQIHVGLFLGSLFCSTDLCVSFCVSTTLVYFLFLFFTLRTSVYLKKKTHLNTKKKTSHIMGKDICKHSFIVSQSLWNRNLRMA